MRNRIALLFAATAVLASCMKENSLTPDQTNDNLVTIKAVAAETKTLLGDDGTSVVWEENDAISVVVEGESDKYLETFTTSSTEKTSIAEFTAVLSNELSADETVTGIGYAVHPATSMTLAGNIVSIVHELPEEQTGTITNGMNLSYAKVDADDIKAGETNAVFYNALTLLKVNVPAGVKSVVLTSGASSLALVGKAEFRVNKTSDDISFYKNSEVVPRRSVTLSNGGAELEEGVHDLLVFPGTAAELTLTMTGTDGAVYESTLNAVELVAGTYRTINLTKIFKMGVEDEMFISPAGGECEVKIASVADYTYNVEVTSTAGGDWLSYTLPTKGFHQDVITFSAGENTTGADRTANVTITWGEDQTRTFKMTQRAVYMDFVNDENGDPIQWEESFGVYASETDASAETNPVKTFTNVFTIGLSDDFSKGAYKVDGIFAYNNSYSGKTGGVYYADYADGILTVYKETAETQSYNFTDKEVNLTYDSANKTFSSASVIGFGYKFDNADLRNGGFIGGYAAAVKAVDEPETPGDEDAGPLAAFIGNWSESFTNSYFMGQGEYNNVDGITVSIVDGKLYFEKMFAITYYGSPMSGSYYGTLSADGKTITLEDANPSSGHSGFGPMENSSTNPIVLNVSDGKLTASTAPYGYLNNYVATR